MSILYLRARPMLAFDVENRLHRQYYFDFLEHGTWGKCPVKFMAESLNTDLVTHINEKILKYYVEKEFKNSSKRVVRKPKAKSALRTL